MTIYLLAYLLASSVLGPFMAEIVMNRGSEDDTARIINNALAFWIWPLLAAIVLAAFVLGKARKWGWL